MDWKTLRLSTVLGLFLVFSLAMTVPAMAQSGASTGIIEGTVTDQSGAVLPGVTLTLRQTENNFERIVVSDDSGRFRARLLPVGPYVLSAELTGFKKNERELVLNIASTISLEISLELGEITQVVTISSDFAPLVDTAETRNSETVNSKSIENLPINGRDFQSFVFLTPGTVPAGRNTVSLGGQKGIETNFQVDGADRNNPFFGGQTGGDRPPFTFSQESVREFVVLQDGFSAEFGRSTAGLVNVVTKSGTNSFHGSAFYLYRDSGFIANTRSLRVNTDNSITTSESVAVGNRHQFGGSFGGPIVRDKAFFFFSTEQQDFGRPLNVVFRFDDAERTLIQQQAPELLAFEGTFASTDDAQVYLGKVDLLASANHNLAFRYTFTDSEQSNGTYTGTTTSGVDNNGLELDTTHQFVANWNSIISNRAVNEFRFNYVFEDRPREANVSFDTSEVRIGNEARVGGVWFLPIPETDDRFQFVDNLSYNFGSHDLKFGFEYNDTGVDQVFFGNGRAQYRFGDLNAFLANDPRDYRQRFGDGIFSARVQEPAFYIQDEWKVSPQFTLNLGLRYESQLNPDNNRPNRSFPAYSGKIVDDTDNWAPRFGFAWDLTGEGKSVLRGSAGIFFGRTPMLLYSNPLVVNGDVAGDVEVRIAGTGRITPKTGGQSFPGFTRVFGSLQEAGAFGGFAVPSSGNFPTADAHLHAVDFDNPESYRYTIGFEQDLGSNWAAGISYSHSDTKNRQLRRDTNLFPGVPDSDGRNIYGSPFRPNRPFSNITTSRIVLVESSAYSDWDALVLTLNKRFTGNFQMQASYTFQDNVSIEDNERDASTIHPSDPDNLRADFGSSNLDVQQNLTVNGVVDLPAGFQVSGIFFINTGAPWNARTNFDNNGDGNANDRPVINGQIVARNGFENDKFSNMDLRVTKSFFFTEEARASAFIEFFNLFNARNYRVSNTTFGRTGFGIPTRQGGNPLTMQLGFRVDF